MGALEGAAVSHERGTPVGIGQPLGHKGARSLMSEVPLSGGGVFYERSTPVRTFRAVDRGTSWQGYLAHKNSLLP